MRRAAFLAWTAAFLAPLAHAADWSLRLPAEPQVVYKGIINPDQAGYGAGPQMMYGPGLIGFAVVLAGHAAFQETQSNRQLQKLQESADKVLLPYRSALADYRYATLMQRALEKSVFPGDKTLVGVADRPASRWLVDSLPVFGMTPDSTALVLENAVSVYPPDTSTPLYRNFIRVVSRPRGEANPVAFWGDNGAEKLKEESARLLAHSLDVLMIEAAGKAMSDGPQKTFRYLQGTTERMERADLVTAYCERALIRTLRGWLMSVPVKPDPTAASCAPVPNDL